MIVHAKPPKKRPTYLRPAPALIIVYAKAPSKRRRERWSYPMRENPERDPEYVDPEKLAEAKAWIKKRLT